MRLYNEYGAWWPLFSSPYDEYDQEAEFARQLLVDATDIPPKTVLELGSGGGNNALYLKEAFQMTLIDLSPEMLKVSQALNPECEHLQGDMRTVRLGRQFDAVFVHDAIMYMTTEADLRQALETTFVHCRPGGVALFEPDCVRETFEPSTDHGGHDGDDGRGLRYLEWVYDPDPNDTTYTVDYAWLMRDTDGSVQVAHDQHIEGLFAQDIWLRLLREVGFEPQVVSDPWRAVMFVAIRPDNG
jgi:SAM-dependent methyltransferase